MPRGRTTRRTGQAPTVDEPSSRRFSSHSVLGVEVFLPHERKFGRPATVTGMPCPVTPRRGFGASQIRVLAGAYSRLDRDRQRFGQTAGRIVAVSSAPRDLMLRLRQHQHNGVRSPHKPLLVLLALGRLASAGSSEISWAEARAQLAILINDFGPPSKTAAAQSAAYPFTRLRSDGLWVLDADVPMDRVAPLNELDIKGRFPEHIETALKRPGEL